MIKVLNLYAGIGGNRKLWKDVEVTAIENNPSIAKIYQDFFPNDNMIITDAHQYLLEHYKEFDFIWSSVPCPSHGISRYWRSKAVNIKIIYPAPIYPDMSLWQEIIFLNYFFKGKYIVENVISYYKPLIKPQEAGNHYFWANFLIGGYKKTERGVWKSRIPFLENNTGFDLSAYRSIDKLKLLRNCVEPELGLHIFNEAMKQPQKTLGREML